MRIIVEGKPALLASGTSFEYVSENRMFSGSDGYTLSISFPLKDCPQNLAIFGHINRADVARGTVVLNCELRDARFYRSGCIVATEISDKELKAQFLDGRSAQNYDKSLDDIYINELDLGRPEIISATMITPAEAWNPTLQNMQAVALPWVNNNSDSGQAHNFAHYGYGSNVPAWVNNSGELSWQPYLLYITRMICKQIDYSCDLQAWEEHEEYRYLLICNCLPPAWDLPEYARALPHWSVEQYFEQLGLLLGGEFEINHTARHISFQFTNTLLQAKPTVELTDIVQEHSTEVNTDSSSCDYTGAKNLVYADSDHTMWKYYSCDWFIKAYSSRAIRYEYLKDLLEENKWLASQYSSDLRGTNMNRLLYAADVDCYFIIRPIDREATHQAAGHNVYLYTNILQPVNLFGGHLAENPDEADSTEIEIVPAAIDYTEKKYGLCLFLDCGSYSEPEESQIVIGDRVRDYETFYKSNMQNIIESGEKDKAAEYFDKIYIGFWDGAADDSNPLPYPFVENIAIASDWENFYLRHFNLRLNDKRSPSHSVLHKINTNFKTTFKFLSSTIPDPRSVFIIRGKRYLCEKLTATFTVNGMSRLIKGTFYPIAD